MKNNNKLIDELNELRMQEKNFKRCLDIKYYDNNKRTELFYKLRECKKNIEKVKFKIRMERKLNANNNTDRTSYKEESFTSSDD